MNLYNMLFGTNNFAEALLRMLNVDPSNMPRFRDCFLSEDGTEIIIHTRTGGGNREEYEEQNEAMKRIPGYKFDRDSDFDPTYANFHYKVPEKFRGVAAQMKDAGATGDPVERWKEVHEALRTAKPPR